MLVSSPTRSCNLNVPELGRPITLPVIRSTSSILNLYLSVNWEDLIPHITPILLPINPGVSLHRTDCFPRITSPNSIKNDTKDGSESIWGITSNSLKYLGGLKKWVPQNLDLKSSDLPSHKSDIGMLEVLEVTKAWPDLYFSTFSKTVFLISRFSTITSIIQSASLTFSKSSSKFPVVILLAYSFLYNGFGLDLIAFFNDSSAIMFLFLIDLSLGCISSIKTSIPTFARWHAIPEPITPDPKTAAFFTL